MLGEVCCYTVLYCLLCLVFVFPPDEIASMGLTVEGLFGSWFGSEMMAFVQYHQKRTAATLLIHSFLLPGYVLLMRNCQPMLWSWLLQWSGIICLVSLAPTASVLCTIAWWRRHNWRRHPLSQTLRVFAADVPDPDAWMAVATEINIQYRRVDKLSTRISSTSQLVATDGWLIQVGSYRVSAMPLQDTLVVLEGALSNTLDARLSGRAANPQTLRLRARCITKKAKDMAFRLSSGLWSELERKLINPVVNTGQVVVQQNLSDQFLEVFTTTVHKNPTVTEERQGDSCIGCMTVSANVRLDRRCKRLEVVGAGEGHCQDCACRPMWCLTCLSKWFAARQDQERPETWLSSRAPCPTCRSPFCLLDVRLIAADAGQ